MNRVEFMTELASLLQDVPVEERREAMRYYNDYFDEAGKEHEAEAVSDLGSPAKVAAKIKEELSGQDKEKEEYREYRETGYQDTRFEQRDVPGERGPRADANQGNGSRGAPQNGVNTTNNTILKVILIILIIVVGAPVVIPVVTGLLGLVVGAVAVVFGIFIALVVLFLALAITGAALVCAGIVSLVPEIAVGLALIGMGLIITVIGVIGTVACVKLCMVVFPSLFRGIVNLCRKPFHRKAVG